EESGRLRVCVARRGDGGARLDPPIRERGPESVQVRRARRGRCPAARPGCLRGFRGGLARDGGGDGRVRGLDERLPQARRLHDPGGAPGVEQLDPDQGRSRGGSGRAQGAARQGHPRLRQRGPREHADPTRPRRRVPAHGLSRRRGEGEAALQRGPRHEGHEARGHDGVRVRRHRAYLQAGAEGARV
ncbi:MAG: Dihydrofolate reductase, partial [uncultured Rubrobacteraceae bacterium]